jgi:hypothetical protein
MCELIPIQLHTLETVYGSTTYGTPPVALVTSQSSPVSLLYGQPLSPSADLAV